MDLFDLPEGQLHRSFGRPPCFQSSETKSGRQILVRVYDPDMIFEDAVKLLMVSFDATIKAHLSVGLQLNVQTYEASSLRIGNKRHIECDNPYYQ